MSPCSLGCHDQYRLLTSCAPITLFFPPTRRRTRIAVPEKLDLSSVSSLFSSWCDIIQPLFFVIPIVVVACVALPYHPFPVSSSLLLLCPCEFLFPLCIWRVCRKRASLHSLFVCGVPQYISDSKQMVLVSFFVAFFSQFFDSCRLPSPSHIASSSPLMW